ncbi:clumping factor A-like isoform X2 [Sander lucioperca]|uniref:clumping factor A-like isoform X2 n=1 Tax=Sander lucioperca TaxID=283035 RepID=UPI00125D6926|nr:clumping factor A-like isoform X2 [Sander lucioperca]
MSRRYFLAYFTFFSSLVAGQSPKYALKGQEFFIMPDVAGHPDGILWKHSGNKVVEFNGNEQQVYTPYENRITLDWVSAELGITELRFEDSGDYELEIEVNKGLHRSIYKLEVIDKVAKPTISCEMSDGSSSNRSGQLVCSAEPRQPLMKFEWRTHGGVQPGPELTISLGEEHDDDVHSCSVSNPLSNETATFTAKDCYTDQSSSVAVIASIISIFLIVLLVVLGILFCKVYHKACFATADLEKQSPPCKTEGSDKKKAQGDENKSLLHRTDTIPSQQPLRNLAQAGFVKERAKMFEQINDGQTGSKKNIDKHKKTLSPPSPPRRESPSPLDLNNLACSDKGDAESDQLRDCAEDIVPLYDPSHSEKANEPDLAGVSYDLEPEKEADEDEEEQSAPASAETTSAAQPHSPLTEGCLNMAPKDATGEHKEDANSDQVTGEIADKNGGESDSSGEEERNESDDSIEDKQPSTVPEQKGSETLLHEHDSNLSQDETQTRESNQQEKVKPVSEDENERNSVGDREDADKDSDLYLATSQQPQSPTPTKADNTTDTFQKSLDTAHADPDREEQDKISHDSDEGQSDKGKGETVEDKNEVKCDLKEEKQGNKSRSQDAEGQKKDEAVGL